MERKEIEIKRPVNPEGLSFIRYAFGAIAGTLGSSFLEKHRKELGKLITRLGYKIADRIGEGYIEGILFIDVEGDEIKRIGVKNIKVFKPVEEINEEISVSNE